MQIAANMCVYRYIHIYMSICLYVCMPLCVCVCYRYGVDTCLPGIRTLPHSLAWPLCRGLFIGLPGENDLHVVGSLK